MKSQSINFTNLYIDSIGIVVSKKEKDGPLGKYFNHYVDNYYFDCKTFEKAQVKLAKASIVEALKKSMFNIDDINIAFGGDLSNQIFSSTSAIKEEKFPFVGIFAACASGILSIILAGLYLKNENFDNALTFTSSHVCVSQRQFRYPTEYGSICKDTTTSTVTGACSIILSKKENKIKVSKATIGKVIDIMSDNVNDMGTIMAYGAIDTFKTHLQNNLESVDDYDLIVTGDLSNYGSKVFKEELEEAGFNLTNKYIDCGAVIYDNEKQKVYSGGSGPACVMVVTFSYVIHKMLKGIYKKVLVIGTGALHSQISYQQKEYIPGIAHAIVLEVN